MQMHWPSRGTSCTACSCFSSTIRFKRSQSSVVSSDIVDIEDTFLKIALILVLIFNTIE